MQIQADLIPQIEGKKCLGNKEKLNNRQSLPYNLW